MERSKEEEKKVRSKYDSYKKWCNMEGIPYATYEEYVESRGHFKERIKQPNPIKCSTIT